MLQCHSAEGQEPLTAYSKKIAPVEEAPEQLVPIKPQPRPAKVEAAQTNQMNQMNGHTSNTDDIDDTDDTINNGDGEEGGQDRGAKRAKRAKRAKLLPKMKEDGNGNKPVEESWGCRENDLGGRPVQPPVQQQPGNTRQDQQLPQDCLERASSPASTTSVASSDSDAKPSFGCKLQTAVTPDGKTITGRCLTYEDARGEALMSVFYSDKLHYSAANPDYHRRVTYDDPPCGVGCSVS